MMLVSKLVMVAAQQTATIVELLNLSCDLFSRDGCMTNIDTIFFVNTLFQMYLLRLLLNIKSSYIATGVLRCHYASVHNLCYTSTKYSYNTRVSFWCHLTLKISNIIMKLYCFWHTPKNFITMYRYVHTDLRVQVYCL